ncbi:TonB-dependent receptor [Niabella sp. CC-SYL272]|uniref:TonB-dependent receptor n=1 Tax=Niabella agricola TaxID=2891571 RepID=UPI001F3B4DBB|nr:TonB-dependent receptor [Niabella agricola]MCF3108100.1 TonB-dependent receptor [Niabella agricola]
MSMIIVNKKQLVLLLFLFTGTSCIAQHLITGKVFTDKGQQLPLPGVQIIAGHLGTVTDSTGMFSISVQQLPATLRVSHPGCLQKSVVIQNEQDWSALTIVLEENYTLLNQVVVTANRFGQRLRDVAQKMELISEKDIAATASTDMTDLIKRNTTVNVIQYPGLLSGIGIRGFRPQFSGLNQRTLLLVNGRPAGVTNMGFLDLNNVARIEILKGPASALYGSQAMGGVVNIITPQSSGPVHGIVNASYGSFNTYIFNGRAGGGLSKKLDFDAAAGFFKRASDIRLGNGNLFRNLLQSDTARQIYSVRRNGSLADSAGYARDTTGDGRKRAYTRYGYYTGSFRLGYRISGHWRADLSGSTFIAKNVESPGEIFKEDRDAGLKDVYRYSGDLAVSGSVKKHSLLFRGYWSSERSDAFAVRTSKGAVIDTPYIARRSGYKWYGFQARDALQLKRQQIIFGYDYNYAYGKLIIFPAPADKQRNEYTTAPNSSLVTHALYAQGQLVFFDDKLHVNPGLRLDHTTFNILETPGFTNTLQTGSQRNNFLSPSLSAQYNISNAVSVHGSTGKAFVTPDASNIAGTTILGKGTGKITMTQGNPGLKNESSWSQDMGMRYARNGWFADLSYFTTRVQDRITSKAAPPATPTIIEGDTVTAITNYYNSDKSYIKGLELLLAYDFGAPAGYHYSLRPFLNSTHYFQYEDTKKNDKGNVQITRMNSIAKNNHVFGIDFSYNKFNTRLSGRYTGPRWDVNYNDALRPLIEFPPFLTMDFYTAYRITPMHQVAFNIENITDENYYEKRGYNMPGRNFRLKYTLNL